MGETHRCPNCGESYQSLTIHWAKSSTCEYPPFSDTHTQILDGLFACGGTFIDIDSSKNSCYRVVSTNKSFLEWVDEQFGVLGRGVKHHMSAEDAAESLEETFGEPGDGNSIDASDVYLWETISHPDIFRFYATWTDDGDESRGLPEAYLPSRLTLAVINAFHGHLTTHGSRETEFQSTFHVASTPLSADEWVTLFDRFGPTVHSQYENKLIVLRNTQGFIDWLSKSEDVPTGGIPGGDNAWPTADQPLKGIGANTEQCPDCNARFISLGHHWTRSDCEPPRLPEEWLEFCTGMLLAGNSINSTVGTHTFLSFFTTSKEFAEWLSDALGILATEPHDVGDTVDNPWGDGSIKFASYRVQTRRVPQFDGFADWQRDGTRTIPNDEITLSSALLRGFYAARGSLQEKNGPALMPTLPLGTLTVPDEFYHRLLGSYQPCIVNTGQNRYLTIRNRKQFFKDLGEPIPGREDAWLDPDEITTYPAEQCPVCDNWYNDLSIHTALSSCSV